MALAYAHVSAGACTAVGTDERHVEYAPSIPEEEGLAMRRVAAFFVAVATLAAPAAIVPAPVAAVACTYTFPDEGGVYPYGDVVDGDVLCGGPGNDEVYWYMYGGTFRGSGGNDEIFIMEGGTFDGGPGNDHVFQMHGGTFYGGPGSDSAGEDMTGGVFYGGPGHDGTSDFFAGTIYGGPDSDFVSWMGSRATLDGGPGDDQVEWLAGGTFDADPGDDLVSFNMTSGTFLGGPGTERSHRELPRWSVLLGRGLPALNSTGSSVIVGRTSVDSGTLAARWTRMCGTGKSHGGRS